MYVKRSMTMILAATAMTSSMSTLAVPITNVTVTGPRQTYLPNPPGVACPDGKVCLNPSSPANIAAALSGAGNVELNKFGGFLPPTFTVANPLGTVTTLSGTFGVGGPAITLSSLVKSDWTANGNALAEQYIQDAWLSLFAAPLTDPQLTSGASTFIALNYWRALSDPNISYVDLNNGIVDIGLDGYLDATPFLTGLAALQGVPLPVGAVAQASEVVKATFEGATEYLYGFHATPTGYSSNDPTNSYTGVYNVTIPEPGALWLLGIGMVGLLVSRRR